MIPWLSVLALLLSCAGATAKGVSVKISAGWRGAPYVLEAAEFLAEESPVLFWQYVAKFADQKESLFSNSGASCSEKIHRLSSEGLSRGLSSVLGVSMGLRQYSAKLQLNQQLSLDKLAGNEESCCWAQVDGRGMFRTAAELGVELEADRSRNKGPMETVSDFDHVYPRPDGAQVGRIITLYAGLGTHCFASFHKMLSVRAEQGGLVYVLRPTLSKECASELLDPCVQFGVSENVALSGFGVEMALKNTEYSAVDEKEDGRPQDVGVDLIGEVSGFLFDVLIKRKPGLQQELLTFRDQLLSAVEADKTLKVWQMKNLGVQASQRIVEAANPIALMADISQNFPSLAGPLSRLEVQKEFLQEVEAVPHVFNSKLNLLILNGIPIDATEFDMLELLSRIWLEIRAMDQLRTLGLDQRVALDLLQMRNEDKSENLDNVKYDLFPRGSIFYFNNLETDTMYKAFPSSVDTLLTPYYQGRIIPVAKNLYTAVVIVDMSTRHGIELGNIVKTLHAGKVPVRFGLLPLFDSSADKSVPWDDMPIGEQTTRLFLSLKEVHGAKAALDFWGSLSSHKSAEASQKLVERAFVDVWTRSAKTSKSSKAKAARSIPSEDALQEVKSATGFASQLDDQIRKFQLQARQKGFVQVQDSYLWINGKIVHLDDADNTQLILEQIMSEMQALQKEVYFGRITNDTPNILKSILGSSFTSARYNPRILDKDVRTVTLDPVSLGDSYSDLVKNLFYLQGSKSASSIVTYWLLVDLGKQAAVNLLQESMNFLSEAGHDSRISLLNTRREGETPLDAANWLERLWYCFASLQEKGSDLLSLAGPVFENEALVEKLFNLPGTDEHTNFVATQIVEFAGSTGLSPNQDEIIRWLTEASKVIRSRLTLEAAFSSSVIDLPWDAMGIVVNGRIIEIPNGMPDAFLANDFVTTSKIATEYQGGKTLVGILSGGQERLDSRQLSDSLLAVASILHKASVESHIPLQAVRNIQEGLTGLEGVKIVAGSADSLFTNFKITALCNPVSNTGQKLSQVLGFLQANFDPLIEVYLNPPLDLSEMPLKQYYRYALPEMMYTTDGFLSSIGPPAAYFSKLPSGRLLTANPDVPKAWLVEAVDAEQDMDNLRMEEVTSDVLFVEYRLESLLLTGSCVDVAADGRRGPNPRGVQLVLSNKMNSQSVDTLVMSNLGYFQLKALPGLWKLQLAKGRSNMIYELKAIDQDSRKINQVKKEGALIRMDSLAGQHIGLILHKKRGMEDEDVLNDSAVESGESGLLFRTLDWLGGLGVKFGFNSSSATGRCEHENDPINIFTIASGHMYERLQKIMVLSVLKTTKSCVKFWFIKNYMSPQMKDFLPHFASKYGFDYDLITYKWPSWLTKQTEKQRIIWAYKILFLDVLFPLNVRRVLFIDADQIVRTDLRELYDMNIRGAPFAYTPFCDNNKEVEGFRFWKGGFWKDHLRGKPYHISALYVVDLQTFRATAAGDKLRIIYENLSKDPNSLANLDQDLPNYAQHSVPIYSLPPEWLWCESWCGNDTKALAKTIDLCNNPMTKEPKLQAARRIVGEWPALDEEARSFTSFVEGLLHKQRIFKDPDESIGDNEHLMHPGSCAISIDESELPEIVENDQKEDRVEL